MTNILVVDVETTTTERFNGDTDFSPYNSGNRLVSVGWTTIVNGVITPVEYAFVHHKEIQFPQSDQYLHFKHAIEKAEIVVAHNAKFDLSWIAEIGTNLDHLVIHDTMIIEYVLSRGMKCDLTLKGLCEKYNVAKKKSDLIDQYFKDGVSMHDIPMETVKEYGVADVQSCAELYLAQIKRCREKDYSSLMKTIQMMNEFCKVLIGIERKGVGIDMVALEDVEQKFTKEVNGIREWLKITAKEKMGDIPVNFDSPDQLSEVLYSRRIKEGMKEQWCNTFNIGLDLRGKYKKRTRMKWHEFKSTIMNMTDTVFKVQASQCKECMGIGSIRKTKKDGSPWTKPTRCKLCSARGVIYTPTSEIAGFKLQPENTEFPATHGFSTDKYALEYLLQQALKRQDTEAQEFITKCIRLSALSSYLSTFVTGVKAATVQGNVLHPNYNQCITRTGRLSSSKPNMTNQPRGNTFPFRKVFVSKFEGGELVDTDFSQLEFRIAVDLAKDENGKRDILEGKDIHVQTKNIITEAGQILDRQEAKSHTFKPLYGGITGTAAEKSYYSKFLSELYPNIGNWHRELQETAIQSKLVTIPSGRQFLFPTCKREWHGGSSHYTMIVNYPVQSFATADIVPISIIRLYNELKKRNLKSHIVLTTHDDVVVDTHPSEKNEVVELCKQMAQFAKEELKKWYNYEMFVPLATETKIGKNLLELKTA